jgi:hypothetical protein
MRNAHGVPIRRRRTGASREGFHPGKTSASSVEPLLPKQLATGELVIRRGPNAQFRLVRYLALDSEVERIEGTGIIAGYDKKITVASRRGEIPITYLSWQEN